MSQPLTQLEYSLVERTSEADLLPMAWHHGITPTAWSPLAGGVLSGKYSQGDSKANDDSARQGMLQSMGQLNDRSLAIADVVKQVATKGFIASDMYHGVVDGKNSIESGFSVYD
jgi:aryl-alcohol dehydrogenase-like predicted oxidoreductase